MSTAITIHPMATVYFALVAAYADIEEALWAARAAADIRADAAMRAAVRALHGVAGADGVLAAVRWASGAADAAANAAAKAEAEGRPALAAILRRAQESLEAVERDRNTGHEAAASHARKARREAEAAATAGAQEALTQRGLAGLAPMDLAIARGEDWAFDEAAQAATQRD